MFVYGIDQVDDHREGAGAQELPLTEYFPGKHIQALQDLFAQAHQMALVVGDLEGNWITTPSNENPVCRLLRDAEKARERCALTYQMVTRQLNENGALTQHECFNCGFIEGGGPVMVRGRHVANCIAGQVNGLPVTSQRVEEYAWSLGVDVAQVRSAYALLPVVSLAQYTSCVNLFAAAVSQILEQSYTERQLLAEMHRLRQTESSLRQEAASSLHANRALRDSIQRVGRELQDVLRYVSEVADEYDRISLAGQIEAAEDTLTEMIQKIRRAYRTVLDAMALEQSQRDEMEKVLFASMPGLTNRRLGRRFAGLLPARPPDDQPRLEAAPHRLEARKEL